MRRHAERASCRARQLDAARRPRGGGGESFFATTCGLVAQVPKASVPRGCRQQRKRRALPKSAARRADPCALAGGRIEGSRQFGKLEIRNVEIRRNIRSSNDEASRRRTAILFLSARIKRAPLFPIPHSPLAPARFSLPTAQCRRFRVESPAPIDRQSSHALIGRTQRPGEARP